MTDLDSTNWHSHGDAGGKPADGKNYAGGDNVDEKHLDYLFDNQKVDKDEIIAAIERRVRHVSGDCIINGLVASSGTNALDVDVSASDGAYVDGQFTNAITATTKTLSTNGGTSTRTDTVYVNVSGGISVQEGSTSGPTGTHKLAEVDVSSSDSISAIRNYGRDIIDLVGSENAPATPSSGDIWYDKTGNELKFRTNTSWEIVATAAELNSHKSATDAHHTRYTDSEARNAVNGTDVTVSGLVLPVGTDKWV